jgi:hypothetical protein
VTPGFRGSEDAGLACALPRSRVKFRGSLAVIDHCIEYIFRNGLNTPNIFDTVGTDTDDVLQDLRTKGVNIQWHYDMRSVGSGFKKYLREAEPLFPYNRYAELTHMQKTNPNNVPAMNMALKVLPEANRLVLTRLILLLANIVHRQQTSEKLGYLFGPCLLRPMEVKLGSMQAQMLANKFIKSLVVNAAELFRDQMSKTGGSLGMPDSVDSNLLDEADREIKEAEDLDRLVKENQKREAQLLEKQAAKKEAQESQRKKQEERRKARSALTNVDANKLLQASTSRPTTPAHEPAPATRSTILTRSTSPQKKFYPPPRQISPGSQGHRRDSAKLTAPTRSRYKPAPFKGSKYSTMPANAFKQAGAQNRGRSVSPVTRSISPSPAKKNNIHNNHGASLADQMAMF